MDIDLEYYKMFYYVGKYGGISTAAKKLCISQPAVSQSIKQLELQLRTKLFIRTPKGVTLTSEGDVLYSYIKQGYEAIIMGEQKLNEMLDLESGEINIGASDMTLQFCLLPYLEQFHKKYPKIKVAVTNAPTPETLEYLEKGNIDFGIISEPFDDDNSIEITYANEIEDIFVYSKGFADLQGRQLEFKDLEKLPIICLEGNTSTRKFMDEFLMTKKVRLKPEFELATSDIIVQFSLRNMGVGCVVRSFAQKYIETGELFELKFKEKIPKRRLCVVTSKKRPIAKAANKLLGMIKIEE